MDYKFGIVYPFTPSWCYDRKLFCLLAAEIPVLPPVPTGHFYIRIRKKRRLTGDLRAVDYLEHEFIDVMGDIVPMTLRAEQEIDMDDDTICYDEKNVQLLIDQGIIRVLDTPGENKTFKVVRVEMLVKPDEMLRWCQACSQAEDINDLTERFKGCAKCSGYQMAYYCSKECQIRNVHLLL